MTVFDRMRRHKSEQETVSDEEQIAHYAYLLDMLPASVSEHAHETAFASLSPEQREETSKQLRPFLTEADRDARLGDPAVLARLARRAGAKIAHPVGDRHAPVLQGDVLPLIAYYFVASEPVSNYFTSGAGALELDDQPTWVSDTYQSASAGSGGQQSTAPTDGDRFKQTLNDFTRYNGSLGG